MKGIEKAVPVFHQFGLYPSAHLGINRNLGGADDSEMAEEYKEDIRRGVRRFLTFVKGLGFTIVNFCHPMSIGSGDTLQAGYPASSTEHIVRFNDFEKSLMFTTLLETIPDFREKIRIFTPLSALHPLRQSYACKAKATGPRSRPFPCRGGRDYFFKTAANGHASPCGYRGDDDLGDYRKAEPTLDGKTRCDRCGWECFRDPS